MFFPALYRVISEIADWILLSPSETAANNTPPGSVSFKPVGVRSKSSTSKCTSRLATSRLTAGCVTFNSTAADENLPQRAATSKATRALREGTLVWSCCFN